MTLTLREKYIIIDIQYVVIAILIGVCGWLAVAHWVGGLL